MGQSVELLAHHWQLARVGGWVLSQLGGEQVDDPQHKRHIKVSKKEFSS